MKDKFYGICVRLDLELNQAALTANAMREDKEKCYEAGMDDYLTKPFKPIELEEAIGRTYETLESKGGSAPTS